MLWAARGTRSERGVGGGYLHYLSTYCVPAFPLLLGCSEHPGLEQTP